MEHPHGAVRKRSHLGAMFAGVVLLVGLAACGGSDDAAPPSSVPTTESTTASTVPTTDTATSTPSTATVVPDTTAVPDSTTPATTEVAVVDPATLSIEELTAELTAALEAFSQAWVTCASQLPACDLTGLTTTVASPQLEALAAIMQGGNTNGWSASNLESYRTQLESVEFTDDNHMALVTACTEDGIVVIDRTGALVTDRFSSNRTVWTFEWIDGTWKITTGIQQDLVVGRENTLCSF